jgi:hypothetical protein
MPPGRRRVIERARRSRAAQVEGGHHGTEGLHEGGIQVAGHRSQEAAGHFIRHRRSVGPPRGQQPRLVEDRQRDLRLPDIVRPRGLGQAVGVEIAEAQLDREGGREARHPQAVPMGGLIEAGRHRPAGEEGLDGNGRATSVSPAAAAEPP